MEISKTFVVRTAPAAAWNFLIDPRRVASCLPGAAITGQRDERTHDGTITVKVGPVSATYRGTMRFERLDPVERTAEISAAGQDVRGKGGARMRMTSRLVERAPGETEVTVVSEVDVMGVLAQFGRGMIQDVSDQMFGKFIDAMRAQLEGPSAESAADTRSSAVAGSAAAKSGLGAAAFGPAASSPPPGSAAEPIDVLSLGTIVVRKAIVRAVRRPVVWIGAAAFVAFAVGYRLLRHRRELATSAP